MMGAKSIKRPSDKGEIRERERKKSEKEREEGGSKATFKCFTRDLSNCVEINFFQMYLSNTLDYHCNIYFLRYNR